LTTTPEGPLEDGEVSTTMLLPEPLLLFREELE
jgi:hypothetical protein